MKQTLPGRKPIRLPLCSYHGDHCYFVTICTRDRRPILKQEDLARALNPLFRDICLQHGFNVYAYCFMPDHLHALLIANDPAAELISTVRAFKGVAAAHARCFGLSGIWQKGFYDHIIRSEESLQRIAWYILMNPVRAGLIRDPVAWPFSGCAIENWKTKLSISESYAPPWKNHGGRRKAALTEP